MEETMGHVLRKLVLKASLISVFFLLTTAGSFSFIETFKNDLNTSDIEAFLHLLPNQEHLKPTRFTGFEPEVFMNASELVISKGYSYEDHYVQTDDGFILNIQRIPHGLHKHARSTDHRPVVLLQHGLCGSSTDFLINPANDSLSFLLADAGADVWLGNMRGNSYSKNHKTLKPSHKAFWNWSFDEMARHDLPAIIDYILSVTKRDNLYYVGHSQGCTTMMIQSSRDKTISSKVAHFYALAPASRLKDITSTPMKHLADKKDMVARIFNTLYHGSTDVGLKKNIDVLRTVCEPLGMEYCRNMLFKGFGQDVKSFNTSRLPVYMSHMPQSTSVKNALHWLQFITNGIFNNYDEGSASKNMKRYGKPTPPEYNLTSFNIPTTVFYGGNDAMVSPGDTKWLLSQIHVTDTVLVDNYNHMDFVWGDDAFQMVYKHIIKHMMKTESQRKSLFNKPN